MINAVITKKKNNNFSNWKRKYEHLQRIKWSKNYGFENNINSEHSYVVSGKTEYVHLGKKQDYTRKTHPKFIYV